MVDTSKPLYLLRNSDGKIVGPWNQQFFVSLKGAQRRADEYNSNKHNKGGWYVVTYEIVEVDPT